MSFARRRRDFDDAKAEGTLVEWLLVDLLDAHGWTAWPNQIVWDAAGGRSAAKAFGPHASMLYVPDIDAQTPEPSSCRIGFEVKSKDPVRMGGYGWDARSFRRAERWQERTGAPVIYAIRDHSIAPLPPDRSKLDSLAPWRFASLHRLRLHDPRKIASWSEDRDGDTQKHESWYWLADVFLPASELLAGAFTIAPALLRPKPLFGADRFL